MRLRTDLAASGFEVAAYASVRLHVLKRMRSSKSSPDSRDDAIPEYVMRRRRDSRISSGHVRWFAPTRTKCRGSDSFGAGAGGRDAIRSGRSSPRAYFNVLSQDYHSSG